MPKGTCSVIGCDSDVRSSGVSYCSAHYQRYMKYGDPLGGGVRRGEPLAFLIAKLEELAEHPTDECVDWPYGKSDGYGAIEVDGKRWSVHDYACRGGVRGNDGLDTRHLCGRRSCFNPRHLTLGTRVENMADCVRHGNFPRGERQGRSKLTEADVRTIRASSERTTVLAERYNVGDTAISKIRHRQNWAWLEDGA